MAGTEQFDFTLAYYSGDRVTGELALVMRNAGRTQVKPLRQAAPTGLDPLLRPILVGVRGEQVVLMDPRDKRIWRADEFPADTFPAHIYPEPGGQRDWLMNDGDKDSGNDPVNCGDHGSSVTVLDKTPDGEARFVKTLCVGRGHHQAAFIAPDAAHPQVPRRVVISNLQDGTLSVINNQPGDADYLEVIATVDLADERHESVPADGGANRAFPHGLVYSPVSGKLYCLNNGYGSIAVIDPQTLVIEDRLDFKGHSNLIGSPDGRYLIGRGADRKSDPEHVIAKLSIMDVTDHRVVDSQDFPDIYFSKYFFNVEGSKLYFTTGVSGSETQQRHLRSDAVLIFDLSRLPRIALLRELRLGGSAGTLDFLAPQGVTERVFASSTTTGQVVVIDGRTDEIVDRIAVNSGNRHSRLWRVSPLP